VSKSSEQNGSNERARLRGSEVLNEEALYIEFELPDPTALAEEWNFSDRAEHLARTGHELLARGLFEAGALAFERAGRYDRTHIRATVGLTESLILMGDCERADRVVNDALSRFGRNAELGAARGHVFLHMDDVDSALACCDTAVRLAPHSGYVRIIAGESRLRIAEALWSAEEQFDTARAAADSWPYLDLRIALAFVEWGQAERAVHLLHGVVQQQVDLPLAWMLLGEAYRQLDRRRDARTCYERAAAIEPDSVKAALGDLPRVGERLGELARSIGRLFGAPGRKG